MKNLNGKKILLIICGGIAAYKSLEIIRLLLEKGCIVSYSDPFVSKIPSTRKYKFNLSSIELSKEIISSFDAVLLLTDHDNFDYDHLKTSSNLLIDTRGRFKPSHNIIKNLLCYYIVVA